MVYLSLSLLFLWNVSRWAILHSFYFQNLLKTIEDMYPLYTSLRRFCLPSNPPGNCTEYDSNERRRGLHFGKTRKYVYQCLWALCLGGYYAGFPQSQCSEVIRASTREIHSMYYFQRKLVDLPPNKEPAYSLSSQMACRSATIGCLLNVFSARYSGKISVDIKKNNSKFRIFNIPLHHFEKLWVHAFDFIKTDRRNGRKKNHKPPHPFARNESSGEYQYGGRASDSAEHLSRLIPR